MLLQFMQLISVRKEALLSFCINDLSPTKHKHISQRTHTQFSVLNVLRRWFPWLRVQEMQLIIILVSEKQVCNKNSFMRSSFVFIHSLTFFLYFNQSPQVHKRSSFICTNVYAGNTKTFPSVNVFFQGSSTPGIKYITIISFYKQLCEKYKDIFKSNNYFPNTVVSFTNRE